MVILFMSSLFRCNYVYLVLESYHDLLGVILEATVIYYFGLRAHSEYGYHISIEGFAA